MGKQSKDKTNNKDIIYINDIDLEYVSTKTDKYDNEISYFKIIDSLVKTKFKQLEIWNLKTLECHIGLPMIIKLY